MNKKLMALGAVVLIVMLSFVVPLSASGYTTVDYETESVPDWFGTSNIFSIWRDDAGQLRIVLTDIRKYDAENDIYLPELYGYNFAPGGLRSPVFVPDYRSIEYSYGAVQSYNGGYIYGITITIDYDFYVGKGDFAGTLLGEIMSDSEESDYTYFVGFAGGLPMVAGEVALGNPEFVELQRGYLMITPVIPRNGTSRHLEPLTGLYRIIDDAAGVVYDTPFVRAVVDPETALDEYYIKEVLRQQYVQEGYALGYSEGYNVGRAFGDGEYQLYDMMETIFKAPFTIVRDSLDFNIFGVNLGGLVIAMLSFAVIIFVVALVLKYVF